MILPFTIMCTLFVSKIVFCDDFNLILIM
jgi:hypothetical protein